MYVKRLRVCDAMQTWPRYILIKLIQLRTGHELVCEWFKNRWIQKDVVVENPKQ